MESIFCVLSCLSTSMWVGRPIITLPGKRAIPRSGCADQDQNGRVFRRQLYACRAYVCCMYCTASIYDPLPVFREDSPSGDLIRGRGGDQQFVKAVREGNPCCRASPPVPAQAGALAELAA